MVDLIVTKITNIFPSWISCLMIIPNDDVYKTIMISLIACVVGYFAKILLDFLMDKFHKHVLGRKKNKYTR
jgi:small-conductance mechanosensitive channel